MTEEALGAEALLEAAKLSLERGDAESLAFALRRAGALGAVNEALALGTSLQHLVHVPASIASRAVALLRREAVASNEPIIAYALARIYALGLLGVEQQSELSYKYLTRAADLGMPVAQLFAGVYTAEGTGCVADPDLALSYFEQAASAGFLFASRQIVILRRDIGPLKRTLLLLSLTFDVLKLALVNPSNPRLFLLNSLAAPWPDTV